MALSEKERDRLRVLHEVEQGHLSQQAAAELVGMTGRGFRKLLRRYRQKGDGAVIHGLRDRKSNRRLRESDAVRVLEAVKSRYSDFGPTLASEYLRREFGIELSRETLRQLMMSGGIWKAKPRRIREIHVWRPRRECVGELIQWDTSVHAWLEDRGPAKMYLISLIDDATSRLFARFVAADSTEHHMRVLWQYIERYGRPLAVYTDKAGLFQPTLPPGWKSEEPGEKSETQMGRAFRELGIEWIAAHSPQAKGRVERCFGTLQDRLVKGLRLAEARNIEEANRYLEEDFLAEWNERFTVEAANRFDAHRSLDEALPLASILSHVEQRQVSNDYTVAWHGGHWQIPRAAVHAGLRRSSIRVEMRLDGTLRARISGAFVELTGCAKPQPKTKQKSSGAARRYVPPPGSSPWMKGFNVEGNAAWKAWREQGQ